MTIRDLAEGALDTYLMLGFASRVAVLGLLAVAIRSVFIYIHLARRAARRSQSSEFDSSTTSKLIRGLNSLFCTGIILAAFCFVDLTFAVDRIYMVDRFTDANPVYALQEAQRVSRIIAVICLSLQVLRWRATSLADWCGGHAASRK
jgi:hypothetical protein